MRPSISGPACIVAAAVSAVLLTACSGAAGTGAGTGKPEGAARGISSVSHAPQPAAVPLAGLAKGMRLPLEAYEQNYPEAVAVQAAAMRIESTCMSRYGFTYDPSQAGQQPPSTYDPTNMERRYGISDPVEAKRYGYHLPSMPQPTPTPPPLSNQEETALHGVVLSQGQLVPASGDINGTKIAVGGCVGNAYQQLGGVVDTSLPDQLDASSLQESQAAPRVTAVINQWSRCMKQAGYTVDAPGDAAKLSDAMGRPTPDAKELAIAAADIRCKQQTNLVSVWYHVEYTIQQQLISAHQAALTQVQQAVAKQAKAASSVPAS